MQDKVCIHCVVSGLVQGVWFRAGTQEQAKKLGLTGWVRNLPEGTVEVFACGSSRQIEEMRAWLKNGPPRAKVSEVKYLAAEWVEHSGFDIL